VIRPQHADIKQRTIAAQQSGLEGKVREVVLDTLKMTGKESKSFGNLSDSEYSKIDIPYDNCVIFLLSGLFWLHDDQEWVGEKWVGHEVKDSKHMTLYFKSGMVIVSGD